MLQKLPDELFTSADLARFEEMRSTMVGRARAGGLVSVKASVTVLALLGCLGIEYVAFKEIYDFLKAPIPGEEAGLTLSPAILALTGAVMVIAMHLRAAMKPDSLPIRVLERAVDVLLPFYMIGAGLMFGGMIFFNGADGLLATSSGSLDLFADNAAAPPLLTLLFERVAAPVIAVAFSVGAGAVVVITVFVGHRCITRLKEYAQDLWGRVSDAREAVAAHAEILRQQGEYRKTRTDVTLLTQVSHQDDIVRLAAETGSVIREELRPYQLEVADRRINPKPNPYEPHDDFNLDEIERRVRAIESITPEEIIAAMRGSFTKESPDEVPPYDPNYDDIEYVSERSDAHRRH